MKEGRLLLLLVAASLLLRLPFAAGTPMHVDECGFIRGLQHYDIPARTPHAPGYFFFIVLGRLTRLLTGDGMRALVLVNAVSGGILAYALSRTARLFGGPSAGGWAAVLGLTAPLSWSYGFGALSYETAAAAAALSAAFTMEFLFGKTRSLVAAWSLLAVAVGIRIDALAGAFPLLWATGAAIFPRIPLLAHDPAAKYHGSSARMLLAALLAAILITALWIFPASLKVGGPLELWRITREIQGAFHYLQPGYSFLRSLFANFSVSVITAFLVLGFLSFSALCALPAGLRSARPRTKLLFLFWTAPPALFYLLVIHGQFGYWLPTVAIPLWVAGAVLLSRSKTLALHVIAVALNVLLVLAGGAAPLGVTERGGQKWEAGLAQSLAGTGAFYLNRYTAAGIAKRDRIHRDLVSFVRARHSPESSWLLMDDQRWMDWSPSHFAVMAPEYNAAATTIPVERFQNGRTLTLTAAAEGKTALILHHELFERNRAPGRFQKEFEINDEGDAIWAARLAPNESLFFHDGVFEIR